MTCSQAELARDFIVNLFAEEPKTRLEFSPEARQGLEKLYSSPDLVYAIASHNHNLGTNSPVIGIPNYRLSAILPQLKIS